ncbi:MAG TPA: hypothetical protein VGW10_17445 [Solirubrobacteraceae bacterium]|nr:hypothetical protein [Solirubrobacteraceae bacterium]
MISERGARGLRLRLQTVLAENGCADLIAQAPLPSEDVPETEALLVLVEALRARVGGPEGHQELAGVVDELHELVAGQRVGSS